MLKFFSKAGFITCAACASGTACLAPPEADAQHGDTLLAIAPDGSLATGSYDFSGNPVEDLDVRIYEGEFEEFFTSNDPGFNALDSTQASLLPNGYTGLSGNTAVDFNGKAFAVDGATANLFHWNGIGAVDFAPVNDGTVLTVAKAPTATFTATFDGHAHDVTGFTIATTTSRGGLHKHLDFSLIGDGGDPASGFYAWSLELAAGAATSDPIYYIHGAGAHTEVQHEAAIDYFAANVVPEPATAVLLALGAPLAVLRRRRG